MSIVEELNKTLKDNSPSVFSLLSKRGRSFFFPSKGIKAQGDDAKNANVGINATIGAALNEEGDPLCFPCMSAKIPFHNSVFNYASVFGNEELREVWGSLTNNPSNASLPIVTCGLTHGLNIVGALFVEEGDRIILPDLFWGNYKLIFSTYYSGNIETFETFKDGFNANGLKEKLDKPGKKIVLLNFPNNPSGYSPTLEEAEEIVKILEEAADKGPLLVVCDDAYSSFVYKEGVLKDSLFSKIANLHENLLVVKIDGVSKMMSSYGLRVGFITYGCKGMNENVSKALESKTGGVIRSSVSSAAAISQAMALDALQHGDFKRDHETLFNELKERFDRVEEALVNCKDEFEALPFNSGFFVCLKLKNSNAEEVRKKLLKDGVGVISIGENLLRIAYSAVPANKIEELFGKIQKACQ